MLEELATADAAADQRWILALLQEHGPGVVCILWRMLGREQDVLDAYQNVVCQLVSRGPNGVGRNRGAYFYRSAINARIELIRRRRRDRNALGRANAKALRMVARKLRESDAAAQLRRATARLPLWFRLEGPPARSSGAAVAAMIILALRASVTSSVEQTRDFAQPLADAHYHRHIDDQGMLA